MTGFVRAHVAAIVLILSAAVWPVPNASADVFVYDGEIFFCTSTCDSFGALGGSTGGSGNTVNSTVEGNIDIPVQGDGSFSFGPADGVPFAFTITTTAIPLADPIIGPTSDCPPPNAVGQLCNPTLANPLPLSPSVATVEGSGMVGSDGNFVSGNLIFTFIVAPFSNNGAVVTFDLSDSSAEGQVFGVVTFTRIAGTFVPAPPELAVSTPMTFDDVAVGAMATQTITVTNNGLGDGIVTLGTMGLMAPFSIESETCSAMPVAAGGGTCDIVAKYEPTAEGMDSGSFTVDSANNDPASISVVLMGNALAATINVAPTTVDFMDTTPIGDSDTLDVTVSNSGDVALIIAPGGVTAPSAPFAIAADGCSGSPVAVGDSCVITVSFDPTLETVETRSFDISSNDPMNPTVTVTVQGAGAGPEIEVTPLIVDIPGGVTNQVVMRTVTVRNTGSAPLTIGMIDGSAIAAPFALTTDGCSGTMVASGETCELMVSFSPTMDGEFMDDFAIPSDDSDEPSVTVMLQGSATTITFPLIAAAPSPVELGDVIVSESNTQVLTVTNEGSADLTITAIEISGDNAAEFSQTNDCDNVAVAAGETCAVMVSMAPTEEGARTAILTITSDADNEPMLAVMLAGTGVAGPQLTLAVQTLAIGSADQPVEIDQSAAESFMVVSSGSTDVTIASVALSGDGAADFAISDEDCTTGPLASMTTCDVEVTFSPLTAGDKTAVVTVTSNDVDEPEQTVAVTGFVLAGSRPELSVPELEIGSSTAPVTVGESSDSEIDITNTGTDPLMVISVVLAGTDAADFSLTEDCSMAPVDRTDSCTITVSFAPTSAGTKTAEVQITTDSVVTRQQSRGTSQQVTIVPIMATAAAAPPPPPAPAGSQTVIPPAFATGDEGSSGACFIATAAYGSYLDPNVQVLRDFRDNVLLKTWAGRKFVKLYYANSPLLADYIARNEGARTATRLALTPVVYAVAYPVPAMLLLMAMYMFARQRRQRIRALAS